MCNQLWAIICALLRFKLVYPICSNYYKSVISDRKRFISYYLPADNVMEQVKVLLFVALAHHTRERQSVCDGANGVTRVSLIYKECWGANVCTFYSSSYCMYPFLQYFILFGQVPKIQFVSRPALNKGHQHSCLLSLGNTDYSFEILCPYSCVLQTLSWKQNMTKAQKADTGGLC